jgi:hypothetical protein
MGFDLSSIFGGTAKGLVDGITNLADEFIDTKAEKAVRDIKIQEIVNTQLKTLTEDVQSARNREIQVNASESASWLAKNTLGMLAIGITLGFFSMLAWMMNYEVPPTNKDILNIMLGSLGSAWIGIVGYYFGSSAGSKSAGTALQKIAQEK